MMQKVTFAFFVIIGLIAADDGPLCLNRGNGQSLCSSKTFPNGKELSKFMESVLSVPVHRDGQLQMTPETLNEAPPAAEIFSQNTRLDESGTKEFQSLNGPESIAIEGDFLYGAAVDAIYKVNMKTGEKSKVFDGNVNCNSTTPCSRPLGIRVKDGKLYCTDAFVGLVEVDINSGNFKVLLPVGVSINGTKLTFPDDLDVDWQNGIIYLSDGSTKWPLDHWAMAVLESDPSGRIIRYNISTGKSDIFATGIRFANGVQLSHDKKWLLVSECSFKRVIKFPIHGKYPAQGIQFTQTLPSYLDNIRLSKAGGYWVASPAYSGKPSIFDEIKKSKHLIKRLGDWMLTAGETIETLGKLSSNEQLQSFGHELKIGNALASLTLPSSTAIYELDAEGKVLQILQSTKHKFLTEPFEDDDALYLGSFLNHYVLKIPKVNYRT